jgi:hypothetical protein
MLLDKSSMIMEAIHRVRCHATAFRIARAEAFNRAMQGLE